MNTRDWNIPIIPATVTKIEAPTLPPPPRFIARWWNSEYARWCVASADSAEEVASLEQARTDFVELHCIDTQPEPQPAENAAVIAELDKLVPKTCVHCAKGYVPFRDSTGPYIHGSYMCLAGAIRERTDELRGEK